MKKITIINGPNLNLLGTREPGLYGSKGFDVFLQELKQQFPDLVLDYVQSNIEEELVDAIQKAGKDVHGIVLNPGGYTHSSVAIGDAIAAIDKPVVEVHISNVHSREPFRSISHVSAKARGTISVLGLDGYALAIRYLQER
jgi:3-dehydroquinate dehydratase II